MLHSIENITINGVDLAYEFNDDNDIQNRYFIVNEVTGRDSYSPELSILTPALVDGGYASHRRLRPRVINAVMTIKGRSYDDMHKRVERLIEVINTDGDDVEITFGDEPGRSYYGQVTDMEELEAKSRILKVRVEITCVDPFKYGDIKEVELDGDEVVLTNSGRSLTEPTFELTAKKKSTFALISSGYSDEDIVYNLIGEPADDEIEVVDDKITVLSENGSTLDSWSTANLDIVDTRFIDRLGGTMISDDVGFRAGTYGPSDELQHGAGIIKELPSAIQDFEIVSTFDINSRREEENWRIGIMMYDENMNVLGMFGLKDNSRLYKRRTPLARVGDYRGSSASKGESSGYVLGDKDANDKARELTLFYLRASRVGSTYSFYVGEWYNKKHVRQYEGDFHDVENEFSGKLKYISITITKYAGRPSPSRLRVNYVNVYELTTIEEDQTPYIIYPGDVVTFDHKNREVLVNGETRDDLLNFGGDFFKMKKGDNSFTISPEDTFDTEITYTEKFL